MQKYPPYPLIFIFGAKTHPAPLQKEDALKNERPPCKLFSELYMTLYLLSTNLLKYFLNLSATVTEMLTGVILRRFVKFGEICHEIAQVIVAEIFHAEAELFVFNRLSRVI